MDRLRTALTLLGDRWTLRVVEALLDGPAKFGELSGRLDGIAPNVLTQRLRDLQAAGMVIATPYSRRPLRLSYAVTEDAAGLRPVIGLLRAWGADRIGEGGDVHDACGTGLELRPWCPTCEQVVEPDHSDLHRI